MTFNLKKLKAPFKEQDLDWRIGNSGSSSSGPWAMVLAYTSARAVQDRLDEVVGAENWKVEYAFAEKGVICKLSLNIEGNWVSKEDVCEFTDIKSFKGGVSGAMKRAASAWGIGRYLYDLTENFAKVVPKGTTGAKYAKLKTDNIPFYWIPPALPDWALPEEDRKLVKSAFKSSTSPESKV